MAMNAKAWWNTAYVSIQGLLGTEYQLRTKTTSLNITGGNPDIEGLDTFGGKITRLTTKEDIEISFDGIPTSHADFDWIMAGQTASTTFSATGATITTSVSTKYRVTLLWTDQTCTSAAIQAITASNEAYRKSYADCYWNGLETSMDAGDILKATLTFKTTDQDADGKNNWYVAAKVTTTGTLAAMTAYTSSTTKWNT